MRFEMNQRLGWAELCRSMNVKAFSMLLTMFLIAACSDNSDERSVANESAEKVVDSPESSQQQVVKGFTGHILLGTWSFEHNGCVETIEYLANGTRNVTSKEEVVKSAFDISNKPLDNGFYTIKDTVVEDNGKLDCWGSKADKSGDVAELFVKFNTNNDQLLFCHEPNSNKCVGPFIKQ